MTMVCQHLFNNYLCQKKLISYT